MPKQKKLIEHTIYWKIIVVTVAYCIVMATLKASDNLAHYLRYSLDADGAIVSEPAPRSVNEYRAMNDCILLEDGSQVCGEANIRATAQFEAWKALEAQNKLSTARYDRVRPLLNFNPEQLDAEQTKMLHLILEITEARGWNNYTNVARLINVAWCESRLRPDTIQFERNVVGTDVGILQFNDYFHPESAKICKTDPAGCINEAITLANKQGFTPWVCARWVK